MVLMAPIKNNQAGIAVTEACEPGEKLRNQPDRFCPEYRVSFYCWDTFIICHAMTAQPHATCGKGEVFAVHM